MDRNINNSPALDEDRKTILYQNKKRFAYANIFERILGTQTMNYISRLAVSLNERQDFMLGHSHFFKADIRLKAYKDVTLIKPRRKNNFCIPCISFNDISRHSWLSLYLIYTKISSKEGKGYRLK